MITCFHFFKEVLWYLWLFLIFLAWPGASLTMKSCGNYSHTLYQARLFHNNEKLFLIWKHSSLLKVSVLLLNILNGLGTRVQKVQCCLFNQRLVQLYICAGVSHFVHILSRRAGDQIYTKIWCIFTIQIVSYLQGL